MSWLTFNAHITTRHCATAILNFERLAELDATIKGVNLLHEWVLKEEIRTDWGTVRCWIYSMITNEKRDRTKGVAELIILRRLGILKEILFINFHTWVTSEFFREWWFLCLKKIALYTLANSRRYWTPYNSSKISISGWIYLRLEEISSTEAHPA